METKANYVLVGSFVLGLMISMVLFLLWISRVDFGNKHPLYDIYFQGSVSGLRLNEDVRYHGIPIGKVKEIKVDPRNIDRILVRVAITEKQLMRESIIASIEAQGLTGFSYVQIQGGSPSSPPLVVQTGDEYPIIPSQPSKIDLLFSKLPNILSSVHDLSENLKALIDDGSRTDFKKLLKNVTRFSEQMTQGEHSFTTVMQEAKNTLRHLNKTIGNLETGVHQGIDKLIQTADVLQDTLHKGQGGLDNTLNRLPQTLKQIQLAAERLQQLSGDIDRNPLGFLTKSAEQGVEIP